LWKRELQKLADETRLEISVYHFPPGTSQWNKIEHRLFSYLAVFEPFPHPNQLRRGGPEIGDFSRPSLRGGSARPMSFAPQIYAGHVAANYRQPLDLSSTAWTILGIVLWHC
jgi:hypothetical protein